jgi:hypothetical protein
MDAFESSIETDSVSMDDLKKKEKTRESLVHLTEA